MAVEDMIETNTQHTDTMKSIFNKVHDKLDHHYSKSTIEPPPGSDRRKEWTRYTQSLSESIAQALHHLRFMSMVHSRRMSTEALTKHHAREEQAAKDYEATKLDTYKDRIAKCEHDSDRERIKALRADFVMFHGLTVKEKHNLERELRLEATPRSAYYSRNEEIVEEEIEDSI